MIRPARIADVAAMTTIVNDYAQKNLMLPRPLNRMYKNVRDFLVIEKDDKIVGCGALHVLWYDLAEIRSTAILDEYQGKGYGRKLVASLIEDAKRLGINQVFMLILPDGPMAALGRKFGFREVPKDELPHKVWGDCLNCPKFTQCDEIAMIAEVAPKIESPHQWTSVISAYIRKPGDQAASPIPRALPVIGEQ